jgi:hypothetical protein
MKIFINIFTMDYITNYYKNLSEQLQRKVDILTKNLYEDLNLPNQNVISASNQPQSDRINLPGKQEIPLDRFEKMPPSQPGPRWLWRPLWPNGTPNANAFNARVQYILQNWSNMSQQSRLLMMTNLFNTSPSDMTGAQFLQLFPLEVSTWIVNNYQRIIDAL